MLKPWLSKFTKTTWFKMTAWVGTVPMLMETEMT